MVPSLLAEASRPLTKPCRVSCSLRPKDARASSSSDSKNLVDPIPVASGNSSDSLPGIVPSSSTSEATNLFLSFLGNVADFLKGSFKPVFVAVALSLLLTTALPFDALAASSGGRVGGSNFSGSRARSYSAPSRSYSVPPSSSYSAPPVYSAPFFAPSPFYGGWGYGVPFFGPTVVVGGGGGGFGFIFNILLFGMVAFFIYQAVTGLLWQTQEEELWEETQRSSVVRLQVGLSALLML